MKREIELSEEMTNGLNQIKVYGLLCLYNEFVLMLL